MRPSEATDQRTATQPYGACPGAPPDSPVRPHPDDVPAGATGAEGRCGEEAGRPESAAVAAVDGDVRGAVGRVLDQVLADRVAGARAVHPLFAEDLAARVADFTRSGGKRTRSRLLWWAMRACGAEDEASAAAALRMGAAVEILQTCALVQDDVMDGSPCRRGRPALHRDVGAQYADAGDAGQVRRFGDAAAVLAGDLALAWADDVVADTALAPDTARRVRRLWGDLRTEMVAGQYLDVHGQLTGARGVPRALRAACLKSALYSVERPLALGAALAGADEDTASGLCSAGRRVGIAFQLRDDLDDVFADAGRSGRPAGGDVREGKATYLAAVARARAEAAGDRAALSVLDRSLGDDALTAAGLDEVREVMVRTGARHAVEARIGRLVTQGLRLYDSLALHPVGGGRLRELLARAAGTGVRTETSAGPLSASAGAAGPVGTAGTVGGSAGPVGSAGSAGSVEGSRA